MKTVSEIHGYWKSPDDNKNNPLGYLDGEERTEFLVSKIKNFANNKNSILEIGCNVGRNLNGLYKSGFKNLSGIEINQTAIDIMQEKYSEMFENINISVGSAEDELKKIESDKMEIVYTMAVLEHIHKDSIDLIISEMIRISKKYIIVIEDEKKESDRHFTRNYGNLLSSYDLKEIGRSKCKGIKGLGKNYMYRVFEK